jgi:hypothetical protein
MSGRLRQTEQPGTESKAGALGGFGVYFNADARIFHPELHDAAVWTAHHFLSATRRKT